MEQTRYQKTALSTAKVHNTTIHCVKSVLSLFTSTVELEVHSQIMQISITTFPNQIWHKDNIATEFSSYGFACNLYSGYFYIPNPPSQFTLPSEMSTSL